MSIEIKVPVLPESVADAVIAGWYKQVGEKIKSRQYKYFLYFNDSIAVFHAQVDGESGKYY